MSNLDVNVLPEFDLGLRFVRWHVDGFQEMRRTQLLSHKCRFELIEGMVLHRSGGSRRHDRMVAEVASRLRVADPLTDVVVDHELEFDDLDSAVTPDIVVFEGGDLPALVVEVSDDAPRLDAQEKANLYAKAGIPTYWHIDMSWEMFYVHRSPWSRGYGIRGVGPNDRRVLTGDPRYDGLVMDELLAAADGHA